VDGGDGVSDTFPCISPDDAVVADATAGDIVAAQRKFHEYFAQRARENSRDAVVNLAVTRDGLEPCIERGAARRLIERVTSAIPFDVVGPGPQSGRLVVESERDWLLCFYSRA
jgi:hypothetical protein